MGEQIGIVSDERLNPLQSIAGTYISPNPPPPHNPPTEWTAVSPSRADVQAAIDASGVEEIVNVPAGSATYTSPIYVTRGKVIKYAGEANSLITVTCANPFQYIPNASAIAANEAFRLTALTINCEGQASGNAVLYAQNLTVTPMSRVRLDHVYLDGGATLTNTTGIIVLGPIWGVADNITFRNIRLPSRGLGNNRQEWDTFSPVAFGGADNFYIEDCTIIGGAFWETGHGGRQVWRYNTGTLHNDSDMFDAHANLPVLLYAPMKTEVYGNVFTGMVRWARVMTIRGGQGLFFNNSFDGPNGSYAGSYDEYDDAICPVNDVAISVQRPHKWYSWGNVRSEGGLFPEIYISSTCYETDVARNAPVKDVDLFSQVAAFDGSTGMGVGLLADRPVSCSLNGAGYWATDESKLYIWEML